MAITKIDFPTASTPSYTPSIATDYNNQNEYIERNSRGYNSVSLSNWDSTTTKPDVLAGSVIEANGAVWDIAANTSISTSGASAGMVYFYFDDTIPGFKMSNTEPSWSATLNGWYNSNDRFTGHLAYWDGVGVYSSNNQDGDIIKNVSSGGFLNGSIRYDWLNIINDSFSSPSADPTGLAFNGTNLISCDRTAGNIYIHTGITSATSSFSAPASAPTGLTFDGNNLISCDTGSNLIYIHDGITSGVSSSFAAPASSVFGLTFDGSNLISCDAVSNLIYIHTGISASISSSFSSPATPTGLAFDGTNLISVSQSADRIYIHDGITSSILARFSSPSSNMNGLCLAGSSLISCRANNIYNHGATR